MPRSDNERRAQPRDFALQSVNHAHKAIQPQFKQIRRLVHSNSEIEVRGRRHNAHYTMTYARRGQTARDHITGWPLVRRAKASFQRTSREYRTRDSLDRPIGPDPD